MKNVNDKIILAPIVGDGLVTCEVNRMLSLLDDKSMETYKSMLNSRCISLAKQVIEAESSFAIDSMKREYAFKNSILNRIIAEEKYRNNIKLK
tara:strand:- start:353 stop:631 length:279 start_codon:yes stop_codon:yes gene_type:complete